MAHGVDVAAGRPDRKTETVGQLAGVGKFLFLHLFVKPDKPFIYQIIGHKTLSVLSDDSLKSIIIEDLYGLRVEDF